MSLTQTTNYDSVTEPVTVDELKESSRIDFTEEDALLFDFIREGREFAEHYIDGIISTRAFEWRIDSFCSQYIELPLRPVDKTTIAISYYDSDGVLQTFTEFRSISDEFKTTITPNDDSQWPGVESGHEKVIITFTAGFQGNLGYMPNTIKRAILLLAASRYENRTNDEGRALNLAPLSAQTLLEPFKRMSY